MEDFFQGKDERIVDGTRYVKYLDLTSWYCVVVPNKLYPIQWTLEIVQSQ